MALLMTCRNSARYHAEKRARATGERSAAEHEMVMTSKRSWSPRVRCRPGSRREPECPDRGEPAQKTNARMPMKLHVDRRDAPPRDLPHRVEAAAADVVRGITYSIAAMPKSG